MLLPDPNTAYSYTIYENPEQLTTLLNEWCAASHSLFYMRLSMVFNQARLRAVRLSVSTVHDHSSKLTALYDTIRRTNASAIDCISRSLGKLVEWTVLAYREKHYGLGDHLISIFGSFIHHSILMLESTAYTKLWWSLLIRSIPEASFPTDSDEIISKPEHSKKLQSLLLSLNMEMERWNGASGADSKIVRLIEEFNTFLHRYTGSLNTDPIIILWKNQAPSPGRPWINVKKRVGPAKP